MTGETAEMVTGKGLARLTDVYLAHLKVTVWYNPEGAVEATLPGPTLAPATISHLDDTAVSYLIPSPFIAASM